MLVILGIILFAAAAYVNAFAPSALKKVASKTFMVGPDSEGVADDAIEARAASLADKPATAAVEAPAVPHTVKEEESEVAKSEEQQETPQTRAAAAKDVTNDQ